MANRKDDQHQISVVLHSHQVSAIDELATEAGVTRAQWIRRGIEARLGRHKVSARSPHPTPIDHRDELRRGRLVYRDGWLIHQSGRQHDYPVGQIDDRGVWTPRSKHGRCAAPIVRDVLAAQISRNGDDLNDLPPRIELFLRLYEKI